MAKNPDAIFPKTGRKSQCRQKMILSDIEGKKMTEDPNKKNVRKINRNDAIDSTPIKLRNGDGALNRFLAQKKGGDKKTTQNKENANPECSVKNKGCPISPNFGKIFSA